MKIIDVKNQDDYVECVSYLESLNDHDRSVEFDSWFAIIGFNTYYEIPQSQDKIFKHFEQWLEDYYWGRFDNLEDLDSVSSLSKELDDLVDISLDFLNQNSDPKEKEKIYFLLNQIDESRKDCEFLIKKFNKKIINNDN